MKLERIVKRRTLADGYLANWFLRPALRRLLWFYAVHGFFIAMSFVYTAISTPTPDSTVGQLILAFQAGIATSVISIALVLIALYALLILGLGLAESKGSPNSSLFLSSLSLVVHILVLAVVGLLTVTGIVTLSETLSSFSSPVDGVIPGGVIALALIFLVDLLVWFLLMGSTVGRSYEALAAALRRVPGTYEYSYGTTVMSSSQRPSEIGFIEQALHRAAGYTDDDTDSVLFDRDRYLVRFLHRNGKAVAASLQERSNLRLMAIFPGRESKSLNTSILLEDSYIIQREVSSEAQGTLAKNSMLQDLAESAGWTVSSDGDALLSLRRA